MLDVISTVIAAVGAVFMLLIIRDKQPLWVAYVDLKAAFDSVDRTALWQLLLSVGLPHRMVELFKALYTDTVSCVRADGCESEWYREQN